MIKLLRIIPFANVLVTLLYVVLMYWVKDYYTAFAIFLGVYVIVTGLMINAHCVSYKLLELEWSRISVFIYAPLGFIVLFTMLIKHHNTNILGVLTSILLLTIVFVIHQFIAQK